MTLDLLGWVATAVFTASYYCRDGSVLRRVQAVAAVLWIFYGVAIAAKPVIVANLIVAAAAFASGRRSRTVAQ